MPVALMSHLMKTQERLVLVHLWVSSFMDPLQFAYQPGIGVDDAIIYLLHSSNGQLEKPGSTVSIFLFLFLQCIQHHPAHDPGGQAGVDHHLTSGILDYLTKRPQHVRVQDCVSDMLLCSTEVPQGTVLALLLFTLYTADFTHSTKDLHLQKLCHCWPHHRRGRQGVLIQNFVDWCLLIRLQINTGKTKELVVLQQSYKYLGVHLNIKLDWTHNTDALIKKGNRRLFLLWSGGSPPQDVL